MKFKVWSYDTSTLYEREARHATDALTEIAHEEDVGADSADLAVEEGGEWTRHTVRFQRSVRVTVGRGVETDDPTKEE